MPGLLRSLISSLAGSLGLDVRLLLETLTDRAAEGRVSTWRLDVEPAANAGAWMIADVERLSVISGHSKAWPGAQDSTLRWSDSGTPSWMTMKRNLAPGAFATIDAIVVARWGT